MPQAEGVRATHAGSQQAHKLCSQAVGPAERLTVPLATGFTVLVIEPRRLAQWHLRNRERWSLEITILGGTKLNRHWQIALNGPLHSSTCDAWPMYARDWRLRYWLASIAAGGCSGPSGSILPWSSRNGGYRSVINAT